ncbi:hypothetical protein [Anaeromicropila herbilytica]|uniref:Butirosin biosynthesis protein H N-terminal domain-containing protein n=1 Tax=Anaeromicropila herbilytica TaxID=2785025 RepID=A0A7R7EGJ8_9FIRM|nr:hypothetical protein [Anaeromicropila herbilytica]BCN28795.1 hypothetical protein bsdtb5_00900 [Anaeromicropila herbilytica]
MNIQIKNKLLDLVPIHFDHNDCLEDQLISVIGWFLEDIPRDQLIWHLCETWKFSFRENKNQCTSLGKALSSNVFNEYEVYQKYYGIDISSHTNATFDTFIMEAKKELSLGKPVVLIQKSYWIPWDPNYNVNKEYTHAYIVLDIDFEEKRFLASDGLYTQKNVPIDFENVRQGFTGEYITFEKINHSSFDNNTKNTWMNEIKTMIDNLHLEDEKNIFNHMNVFADRVQTTESLIYENRMGSTNFVSSDLYNALSVVINSRKKLARFMKYLESKNDIKQFSDFTVRFDFAATKWYDIQHKFLKASFLPDFTFIKSRIVKSIREVKEVENDIAIEMKKFILNEELKANNQKKLNQFASENKIHVPATLQKTEMIDMTKYFNNKGFGEMGQDGIAFAEGGQYFSIKNLPKKKIWMIDDMKFNVPNFFTQSVDNLRCERQLIEVKPDSYHCLMLLGCSEQGSFSGEVEIGYLDGSSEKVIASLSDWYLPPQFTDCMAWQGNIIEKVDGEFVQSTHLYQIFASKYSMNKTKKTVVSIRMPECQNMHIFAITFGK